MIITARDYRFGHRVWEVEDFMWVGSRLSLQGSNAEGKWWGYFDQLEVRISK